MKSPFLRRFGMPSPFFDNEAGFSPSSLLLGSTALVWLDPSDLTTLYQDAAGTTPVTAPGQPVGLALDKSQGLVLGPELVTNGDFSANVTGWTESAIWAGQSTLSWSAGAALLTTTVGVATGARYVQALTGLTVGRTYKIGFTPRLATGNGDRIVVWTNDANGTGGTTLTQRTVSGWNTSGEQTHHLTATATTMYIAFGVNNASTLGSTLSIDNISVRELPGFHARQTNADSRPTYGVVPSRGRVNLLTRTEEFNDAVWIKSASTTTANAATAPDGTTTAETFVPNAGTVSSDFKQTVSGLTIGAAMTYSVYLKDTGNGSGWFELTLVNPTVRSFFDLRSGVKGNGAGAITSVGNGWYRCSVPTTLNATTTECYISPRSANGNSGPITATAVPYAFVWGAQLELGPTASPYQRVGSQFDVTDPAGFPTYPCHYLGFDGVDDFMVTPTITPGGDKVQVFAGVRKLSDAAQGIVAEFSAGSGNGRFALSAPSALLGDFGFNSLGTSNALAIAAATAPNTSVVVGLGDIAGDTAIIRRNGVQVGQNTADQGTGNFLAYPLYIGRRGGTSLPANIQLFGLIVRFSTANLDAGLISQTERWVAGKTPGVVI